MLSLSLIYTNSLKFSFLGGVGAGGGGGGGEGRAWEGEGLLLQIAMSLCSCYEILFNLQKFLMLMHTQVYVEKLSVWQT